MTELGSQEMIEFFTRGDGENLVSVLAAVEVRSAIRRRQFAGDTDAEQASLAIRILVQETKRLLERPITASVITSATGLVDKHGLRSLDSIQLASALAARQTIPRDKSILFVTSDHKLLKAAEAEGLITWNPATGLAPASR